MERLELLQKATFNVKFKVKDYLIEENGINYERALMLANKALEDNESEEEFCNQLSRSINSFGFTGFGGHGIDIIISAYLPNVDTGEKHTCPRRAEGPWYDQKNIDTWEMRGDDKCCSYCGSIHPDRVIDLLKELGTSIFGGTTKGYKGYIHRDNVPNAGFGGIKFYTQHFDKLQLEKLNSLLAGGK